MSFILRQSAARTLVNTIHIIKRSAHKKTNLEVRLTQYIDGLGAKGQIVSIRPGMMRNVLYPAGKAVYIKKGEQSEIEEIDNSAELLEQKQQTEKIKVKEAITQLKDQALLDSLKGIFEVHFERAVIPNTQNTFGSVTAEDIANKLKETFDVTVDKATIQVESEGGRIKALGSHSISVQIGQQVVDLKVNVKAIQ